MGRISLYEKLSRRSDFEEIKKRCNVSPDPQKYIQDTFSVSNQTASRFVDELKFNSVSKSDSKPEKYDVNEKELLRARVEVESLDSIMSRTPSTGALFRFIKDIDDLKIGVIVNIFQILSNKVPKVVDKDLLIRAIKYMVQTKYYKEIFKQDIPEKIKTLSDGTVQLCLSENINLGE